MKPLVIRGMDYYCPECNLEMYALSVSSLIKNGGKCPWCQSSIRKGETIEWKPLNSDSILLCDMTTQHISNIIDMLEIKGINTEIFDNELKFRDESRLPYVPYYDLKIEKRIRGTND